MVEDWLQWMRCLSDQPSQEAWPAQAEAKEGREPAYTSLAARDWCCAPAVFLFTLARLSSKGLGYQKQTSFSSCPQTRGVQLWSTSFYCTANCMYLFSTVNSPLELDAVL